MLKETVKGHFENDKYVFFWGGPFSNWYKSAYTYANVEYNCSEQHLMAAKALLFQDTVTYYKILTERNPREQKALGRAVANYDEAVWEKYREGVMFSALYQKFSQNKDLLKILLDTGDKTIVESSPYDRVWGIGLHVDDENILNESKWMGLNLLGKSLMKTRIILASENIKDLES